MLCTGLIKEAIQKKETPSLPQENIVDFYNIYKHDNVDLLILWAINDSRIFVLEMTLATQHLGLGTLQPPPPPNQYVQIPGDMNFSQSCTYPLGIL